MKTRIPIDIHEIPKALLVGVQAPYNTSEFIDSLSLDYNIRNTSKTNVNPNWSTVTKRFFFG